MPKSAEDMDDFKFPDEVEDEKKAQPEAEGTSEFEIEIVDDTPPEDRGRTPMPKELVKELEGDELDAYDEGVKTKLKQMRKVWHDERREKESALREQQEALKFAQQLLDENKKIKAMLTAGEKEYVASQKTAASAELMMAKRAFKEAHESGDSDKMVEAQESMNKAQMKLLQAESFKLPSLQAEKSEVQIAPQRTESPVRPTADRKALAWHQRNQWYGQDEEMTATALGLHQKLVRSGADIGSDEYYATLDKTMRKRFPEFFEDVADKPKNEPKPKPSTVVAPAVRSTSSKKVRLTATQVQLAKKFGLTPEQYVREALKLENANG